MEIQINELLIEPKIWQLFYHFEHDKRLISEIFSTKSHSQINNCFYLNDVDKNEETISWVEGAVREKGQSGVRPR